MVEYGAMWKREALDNEGKRQRLTELYEGFRGKFEGVPEVTVDDYAALAESEPVVLVDVRTDVEREVSMIPGAISADEFEARKAELDGSTVVPYCTVGYRSGLYARELQQEGWRVANMVGSIVAWTYNGGSLVNAEGETRRVHVAGPQWSFAADGYEPVW